MVDHVKKHFINHYKNLGPEAVRQTVEYGYARAKRHGSSTVRNVCLYITNMILLGSNFDIDPVYPWAIAILIEKSSKSADSKMDELSRQSKDYIQKVSGPSNLYIFRALTNFAANSDTLYQEALTCNLENVLSLLEKIYSPKVALVGEEPLSEMVRYGIRQAKSYGLREESSFTIYSIFMFLMGSGFDKDPQFPWASDILENRELSEMGRMEILYDEASQRLITALTYYQK